MLTNKCYGNLNKHTYLEYDDSDIHTYIESYIRCNLEEKKIYYSYFLKEIGNEDTFPYSHKQSHYLNAEIIILSNNRFSNIQVYIIAHDLNGEKKFTQEEVDPLQQTMLKKLQETYDKRNINFL